MTIKHALMSVMLHADNSTVVVDSSS